MIGDTITIRTHGSARTAAREATDESPWTRAFLIGLVYVLFGLILVLPVVVIFNEALADGWGAYFESFKDPYTLSAIRLTLLTAAIVVPLNTVFGLMAAWCISRFHFRGRSLLSVLIDLPLWVSPVIGGLIYVLLYGRRGWLGPWLEAHDLRIVFAQPGIIIATTFVTFPFVARTLIPLMTAQGHAEEEAGLTLGAGGWRLFWRVTVPKIKWGLLYGVILCSARAMGEFGAVSVVSGHIRGRTDTLTLQVENLFNEPATYASSFAVSSLLLLLALVTLSVKAYVEWRADQQEKSSHGLKG